MQIFVCEQIVKKSGESPPPLTEKTAKKASLKTSLISKVTHELQIYHNLLSESPA